MEIKRIEPPPVDNVEVIIEDVIIENKKNPIDVFITVYLLAISIFCIYRIFLF